MLLRLLFAAFTAGAIAGLAITLVQQLTTTPLILQAETFEKAGAPADGHPHTGGQGATHSENSTPSSDLARTALTALTNVILGVGFALILNGCFVLHGRVVNGRNGLLWGLAGFAVFTLGPAIGLPPEPPGMAQGNLLPRQGWWFLAAACTGGGLWLLAFKQGVVAKIAGVAALALPTLIGAPHPGGAPGVVPAELASRFAAASIVLSAVFWSTLGWLAGIFHARFTSVDTEETERPDS